MQRLTIKQLETLTSKQLVLLCIYERQAKCTNVYSPVWQRLERLKREVEKLDALDKSEKPS